MKPRSSWWSRRSLNGKLGILIAALILLAIVVNGLAADYKSEFTITTVELAVATTAATAPATQAFAVTPAHNTSKRTAVETAATSAAVARSDASIIVHVTGTGIRYHRAGCCWLKSDVPVTLADAKARGYTPCNSCQPPW